MLIFFQRPSMYWSRPNSEKGETNFSLQPPQSGGCRNMIRLIRLHRYVNMSASHAKTVNRPRCRLGACYSQAQETVI